MHDVLETRPGCFHLNVERQEAVATDEMQSGPATAVEQGARAVIQPVDQGMAVVQQSKQGEVTAAEQPRAQLVMAGRQPSSPLGGRLGAVPAMLETPQSKVTLAGPVH